jgi:carbon-monoxide dehydrogenase large subunit
MKTSIVGRYVGSSVTRVEDDRLLVGNGRYIADIDLPGLLHAAFLRSSEPHAVITSIDAGAARRLPGVRAVITGEEMQRITNPMLNVGMLDGLYAPLYWPLAVDRVRMVGDPVAIVVAESRYVAEDALELIDVVYEPLDAVATIDAALDPAKPKVWDRADGNVLLDNTKQYGDVDAAFAAADRVVARTFDVHRHSNQPMETRGCVAEIDPTSRALTLHSATQNSHALKWYVGLVSGRQTVWESLTWLNQHRDHVRRLVTSVRTFVAENRDSLGGGANQGDRHDASAGRDHRDGAGRTGDHGKQSGGGGPAAGLVHQVRKEPATVVHLLRAAFGLLAKDETKVPEVEAQDIGGAFGCKAGVSREEVAVCAAALELGRSVKWIEDRNEHLAIGGQARDERMRCTAAVKDDGELLAMRVELTLVDGAYPATPTSAAMFPMIMRVMMPGVYRLRAFEFATKVLTSNKGPYVAYRGPWATETWVRERMLDVIARELGMSPAEIRLRNMVTMDELPTPMITGPMLDVRMSARTTLDKALEIADLARCRSEQEAARADGRMLGIGIATYHEAAPGPPDMAEHIMPGMPLPGEPARTVLEADGSVSVYIQQMPHGQSHETTFAQVAADELGVAPRAVTVRFGDTRVTPFGLFGTGGSRAGAMTGGAVTVSSRALREQIVEQAAELLEAAPDDVRITDGAIHVAGVPARSISFADVASNVGADRLEVRSEYDGGEGGWAMATHVCWVEVDLDTGFVRIPRYVVVEDCGELINPAIVDGQIRGGVAQGVGAVLYERTAYDDDANLQTGTFMDYLIPTSMEIPEIEIHHVATPSTITANYRGVGEGGMIGSPPAITNAIEDALAHLGVTITEQHLPPTRILELAGVIADRASSGR